MKTTAQIDPLDALRAWLATKPIKVTSDIYREWAAVQNKRVAETHEHYPSSNAIGTRLGIAFQDAVRVARGEIEMKDATQGKRQHERPWWSESEADVVGQKELPAILGVGARAAERRSMKHGFPVAVLLVHDRRLWLRSDVEAYSRDDELPPREPNELAARYTTAMEASQTLAVTINQLRFVPGLPKHIGMRSGFRFWLRSEIEAFQQQRAANPGRGAGERVSQTRRTRAG